MADTGCEQLLGGVVTEGDLLATAKRGTPPLTILGSPPKQSERGDNLTGLSHWNSIARLFLAGIGAEGRRHSSSRWGTREPKKSSGRAA